MDAFPIAFPICLSLTAVTISIFGAAYSFVHGCTLIANALRNPNLPHPPSRPASDPPPEHDGEPQKPLG